LMAPPKDSTRRVSELVNPGRHFPHLMCRYCVA
jgi:hypothetical protein